MRVRSVAGALVFAALVAIPASVEAQTPIRYGVVAGLNLASASGDVGDIFDESRTGFAVGGAVEFGMSPTWSIRPEVLYAQKGAKVSEGDDEFRFNTSYIEVPVLAKYAFPMQGSVRPHLLVGPALAFNTGCELELEIGGDSESADCEDDGLEISSLDYGFMFGAGVDIGQFNLGIRYDLGLNDIPDTDDADGKNRVLSFVAGFTFGK
jgi:opacity protein-like surface antigen